MLPLGVHSGLCGSVNVEISYTRVILIGGDGDDPSADAWGRSTHGSYNKIIRFQSYNAVWPGAREPGGGAIAPPNVLSQWDGYACAAVLLLKFGNHYAYINTFAPRPPPPPRKKSFPRPWVWHKLCLRYVNKKSLKAVNLAKYRKAFLTFSTHILDGTNR